MAALMDGDGSRMQAWLAQPVLFAPKVSRRALAALALPAPRGPQVAVNVWRNHAFEPLLPLMAAYTAWGGWQPAFTLGAYDDALTFSAMQPADVELVWLDRSRLRLDSDAFVPWLRGRLLALRTLSLAPIVLCTWAAHDGEAAALRAMVDAIPGAHFADLGGAAAAEHTALIDTRSAALAGTPLASAAQLLLARRLACHWLPAAALPPIKALALDLDHTLHQGVLGEDGIHGVCLTPAHAALQAFAKTLRSRGVFLALVSRNESADVQALFDARGDFCLQWADFSSTQVSWGDKASAIARIAADLRIAPDAVLYVDDNAGELLQVAAAQPQVPSIHAHEDAALTQAAVAHHPGLWRWKTGADDTRRVLDLQANAERSRLAAASTSPDDAWRQLQVTLAFQFDAALHLQALPRLAELCRKTNQFNLSLARCSESALAHCAAQGGLASVALQDRLADSGTVAVIATHRQGRSLVVDELCISCRAMGRGLEDSIVLLALQALLAPWGDCTDVLFHVREADRNQPARQWLATLLNHSDLPAAGQHRIAASRIRQFAAPAGLTIHTHKTEELHASA